MQSSSAPIKISDSEWEIMRVIWTLGKSDAQEVTALLSESKDWKTATVKTLLGRLVKKGVLRTETQGKKFVYYPLVSEDATIQKIGQTLAEMIRESELTNEDLTMLEEALAQKEPVAAIACNCIPGQCQCTMNEGE